MRRACQEIHPIPVPTICPICADFLRLQGQGPGRLPASKDQPELFGANEKKARCPAPEGADEAVFLDEPEQLNVCDAGSGSGGSGGACDPGGNCGVAAVYCQGNVLMVVYTSPFVLPTTTTTTTTTTTSGPLA